MLTKKCPGCSGLIKNLHDDDSNSSSIQKKEEEEATVTWSNGRLWHTTCLLTLHPTENRGLSSSLYTSIDNEESKNQTWIPPFQKEVTTRQRQRNRKDFTGQNTTLPPFPIALPLTVLDVNIKQSSQLHNENDIESAAKIINERETNLRKRVQVQLLTNNSVPSLAFFSFSLEGVLHRCLAMGLVRERPYRFRMIPGTLYARDLVSFCVETGQVSSRADAVRIGNCLVEAGLLLPLTPLDTARDTIGSGSSSNVAAAAAVASSTAIAGALSSAQPPLPPFSQSSGLIPNPTEPQSAALITPQNTQVTTSTASSSSSPSAQNVSTMTTTLSANIPSSLQQVTLSSTSLPFQDKDGLLFIVNLRSRGSLRDAVLSHATQSSIPINRRRKSQISGGSNTVFSPSSQSHNSSSSFDLYTPSEKNLSATDLNMSTKRFGGDSIDNSSSSQLSPDFNNTTFGIGSIPNSNSQYGLALLSSLPNVSNAGDLVALSPHSGSFRARAASELISSPLTPTGALINVNDPDMATVANAGIQQDNAIPTSLSQTSLYRERGRSRLDSNASWEARLQNNAATFSETSVLLANNMDNTTVSPIFPPVLDSNGINPIQFTPSFTNKKETISLVSTDDVKKTTAVMSSNNVLTSTNVYSTPVKMDTTLVNMTQDITTPIISTPKPTSVLEFAVARLTSAVFSSRSSKIRQQPGIASSSIIDTSTSTNGVEGSTPKTRLVFGRGRGIYSTSLSSSTTSSSSSTSASNSIFSSALATVSMTNLPPTPSVTTTRRSASSAFLNIGSAKDDPLADSDSDSDIDKELLTKQGEGLGGVDIRDRDISTEFSDGIQSTGGVGGVGGALDGQLLVKSTQLRGSSVEALDRRRRAVGLATGKSDFQVEKDRLSLTKGAGDIYNVSGSSPDFSGLGSDTIQQPLVTLLPPTPLLSTPAALRDRRKFLVTRRNELQATQWMSGWLVKQGHIRKSWKRRWFVLSGDVLVYFKQQIKTQVTSDTLRQITSSTKPISSTSTISSSTIDLLPQISAKQTSNSAVNLTPQTQLQTPTGTIGIKDFTLEQAQADRFPKPFGMRLASKSIVTLEYLFYAEDESSYIAWSNGLNEALKAWDELEIDIGSLQQAQAAAALEIVASDARQWGGAVGTRRR
jgi:hypothetical protein